MGVAVLGSRREAHPERAAPTRLRAGLLTIASGVVVYGLLLGRPVVRSDEAWFTWVTERIRGGDALEKNASVAAVASSGVGSGRARARRSATQSKACQSRALSIGAQPTGTGRALYAAMRAERVDFGGGALPAEELRFLGGSEGLRAAMSCVRRRRAAGRRGGDRRPATIRGPSRWRRAG